MKVGVAEVVFVRKEDAVSAYRKYNNRCLDGECQEQERTHEMALWVLSTVFCLACSSMTAAAMRYFGVWDMLDSTYAVRITVISIKLIDR